MRELADNACTQPNRERIVELIKSGASCQRRLGVELEHQVVRRGTGAPVPYSGPDGVGAVLESLRSHYTGATPVHTDGTGGLLGLACPEHTITLEPAAQIEVSLAPVERVSQVAEGYALFRALLDPALDAVGAFTPELAYHPTAHARDLELIPKFRYQCMTRYLGSVGYQGPCMMRGSSSLQVSIDYRDEADALAKFKAANAIGPALYLMLDNAPVYEGAPRPRNTIRALLWEGCDPQRCRVVPGAFDEGFSLADYADWILAAPAILVPDAAQERGWRFDGRTFNDIYAEHVMDDVELSHAMSMFWPDVRLKNFIEIRQADAVPAELACAYTALIKGLFYDDSNLSWMTGLHQGFDDTTVPKAKAAIVRDGYDAVLFAGTAAEQTAHELATELVDRAARVLDDEERAFLAPLAKLVADKLTPADTWENPFQSID